jgi:hypothetical protein
LIPLGMLFVLCLTHYPYVLGQHLSKSHHFNMT